MRGPRVCGDVRARDEGQGPRRNGPEIHANVDNKSMRLGDTRRIFSLALAFPLVITC